eukprot:Nitzschia sp. Nitz4//scaffold282_size24342//7175//8107//NITZ4_008353-RA/size24342-processed-gene-0.27-mRNA-1//1//CDS//3329545623//2399//frame0
MSSTTKKTDSHKSSFEAFAKVEEIVSKPILGSDGAASWQEFRKDLHVPQRSSNAPRAPLKKADKLGTGFKSWEEERSHEETIRKELGQASTGSGYTTFKKKHSAEEAAERKRIKQVEAKIRPDKEDYFIPATTFQGWKFNYVFTTREGRGTGYYWDGTDAVKQLRGELEVPEKGIAKSEASDVAKNQRDSSHDDQTTVRPKKKAKKSKAGPVIVEDPNNPREQIANLIRQRQQQQPPTDPSLPEGWEVTYDASSGKPYYFNRSTNERTWEKPEAAKETALPEGWNETLDKSTGKKYYYHTNGQTSWARPS